MKLIIGVFKDQDADTVIQALTASGFRVTRVASTGGFFWRGSSTLLVGLDDDKVEQAIQTMRDNKSKAEDARATIFVVDVARFEQI
jgi:uncharacterized protein YaaQ